MMTSYELLRRDNAAKRRLQEAYAALGLRHGTPVVTRTCEPSGWRADEASAVELERPYVLLLDRDGRRPVVVAGDTMTDVRRFCTPLRPGPNGPIDQYVWLRTGND